MYLHYNEMLALTLVVFKSLILLGFFSLMISMSYPIKNPYPVPPATASPTS
jgi:hypothetical protein